MRTRLFSLALLFVGTLAYADVVELVTGERVEGKSAQATADKVTVEVGGQSLSFDREKVRAIYFGAAPVASPSPVVSRAREVLQALKALQSVAQSGVTYRDYAPRVLDAKIKVDQYASTPDSANPEFRARVIKAMGFYALASSAWNARISGGGYETVGSDPLLQECQAIQRYIRERQAARPASGLDAATTSNTGIIVAVGGVPALWTCASEHVAEAEKLLE